MQLKRMLVALIIISLALFSCKDSGAGKKGDGKVKLTVLHYQDVTAPEAKVEDQIFAAFKEANPNIELEFEKLFGEAFHQKSKALAAANKVPDLIYMWPGGRSVELIENKLVANLYPYLGSDKTKFVDSAVAPQGRDADGLYELPHTVTSTHVLYVNTKILKELNLEMPKTFEELVAMVPAIKAGGYEAIIMPNKSSWVMQSCLFSTIVGRMTGHSWAWDVYKNKAEFTDQGFVDSLALVKQFYDSGLLSPSSIQLEYGDGPNLFAEGKGAFMIDGDWRVNAIAELMSEEQQEEIELTVLPDINGQLGVSGSTSVVAGTGFGMNAKLTDEKAAAAFKFVYFFSGPEAAELRLTQQGVIPAYKMDITKYDLSPLAKKRGDFAKKHAGSAVLDNVFSGKVIDRMNNGLQAIAIGDVTPEELAAELNELHKKESK